MAKHSLSFDVNVREGKPSNTKNNRMKASFSGRWHGYNTLAALALAQHALSYSSVLCFERAESRRSFKSLLIIVVAL